MASSLSEIIKRMAMGANDASAPTSILFGKVTSVEPIEINVEQKMTLTSEFLILTKNVKDYTVDVTVDWTTENKALNANHSHALSGNVSAESGPVTSTLAVENKDIDLTHNHGVKGKKQITIHNALKVNDNVILIRQQGGLNFVVLDKI